MYKNIDRKLLCFISISLKLSDFKDFLCSPDSLLFIADKIIFKAKSVFLSIQFIGCKMFFVLYGKIAFFLFKENFAKSFKSP